MPGDLSKECDAYIKAWTDHFEFQKKPLLRKRNDIVHKLKCRQYRELLSQNKEVPILKKLNSDIQSIDMQMAVYISEKFRDKIDELLKWVNENDPNDKRKYPEGYYIKNQYDDVVNLARDEKFEHITFLEILLQALHCARYRSDKISENLSCGILIEGKTLKETRKEKNKLSSIESFCQTLLKCNNFFQKVQEKYQADIRYNNKEVDVDLEKVGLSIQLKSSTGLQEINIKLSSSNDTGQTLFENLFPLCTYTLKERIKAKQDEAEPQLTQSCYF
ncbi:hypothetical protein L3V79_03110 [Thiotrichales bacterium 19S9-12]|nr:hypothetical protein [Thiotrichales bacterium 19S9-11]MCF6811349.1 hypothetical protein [Thiotrichales bacterium 19S9-12]